MLVVEEKNRCDWEEIIYFYNKNDFAISKIESFISEIQDKELGKSIVKKNENIQQDDIDFNNEEGLQKKNDIELGKSIIQSQILKISNGIIYY